MQRQRTRQTHNPHHHNGNAHHLGQALLLEATETANDAIGDCIFAAAEKYGAEIHALSVLSTHIHTELTIDPDNLSDFNAWVHRHIAQCLIEHYGNLYPKRTFEVIWSNCPW